MNTEIKNLVEAVRKVVKAHLELKKAHELEAADRIKKVKSRILREALDKLTDAMVALEQSAIALKQRGSRPPFNWDGLFRTGAGFLNMVMAAKRGSPDAPKKAQEFIDATWSDVKD